MLATTTSRYYLINGIAVMKRIAKQDKIKSLIRLECKDVFPQEMNIGAGGFLQGLLNIVRGINGSNLNLILQSVL